MAHILLGIDIGAEGIRVVRANFENKRISTEAYDAYRYKSSPDEDGEYMTEDLGGALSELMRNTRIFRGRTDGVCVNIEPSAAQHARLALPFDEPRMIEQVLRSELQGVIELAEDDILSFKVGKAFKRRSEDGEEESVYDIRVLSYPTNILKERLEVLESHRLDPHIVLPTPIVQSYAPTFFREHPQDYWAISDVGAENTVVTVFRGSEMVFARSLKVGGARATRHMAEAFGMTFEEAEALKVGSGFLAQPGEEMKTYQYYLHNGLIERELSEGVASMATVCMEGYKEIFMVLRQTFMSLRYNEKISTERIFLTGGGAKIAGFAAFLESIAHCPCSPLPLSEEYAELPFTALCAAQCAVGAVKTINPLNLRRGALSYKGSFEYIKEKRYVIAAVCVLLICAALFAFLSMKKAVETEHAIVEAALKKATKDLFDKQILSLKGVQSEMNVQSAYGFIPAKTAFTHFEWISDNFSESLSDVEFNLDLLDIDNQRKIVEFRGDVKGDEGLPRILEVLEKYECFPSEIPEPGTTKTKELVNFRLRVNLESCN